MSFCCWQVRDLAAYLKRRASQALHVQYEEARVVQVLQAGTGDRCAFPTWHTHLFHEYPVEQSIMDYLSWDSVHGLQVPLAISTATVLFDDLQGHEVAMEKQMINPLVLSAVHACHWDGGVVGAHAAQKDSALRLAAGGAGCVWTSAATWCLERA